MKRRAETYYNSMLNKINQQMGTGSTDNHQLHKFGKKLFKKSFRGVFAANQIPKMNNGDLAIINLSDLGDGPGSHWIGLVKTKEGALAYDSFGRRIHRILPKLIQSGNGIISETESDAEQSKSQDNCGQRCLAYLATYRRYGYHGAKFI